MEDAPDDRKYKNDPIVGNMIWDDFCETHYDQWMSSPLSQTMRVKDVCTYAPGDLNKIGKEGKTSWDSFSYSLLMNHNIYLHIRSVQETNRHYDLGEYPWQLVDDRFNKTEMKDVIQHLFTMDDRDKQMKLIEDHSKLWMRLIGSRGYIGKKVVNSSTQFHSLFEEV